MGLRSLKQTLHLHTLRYTTPDMAAKQLAPGVAAYNFIRAAIYAAVCGRRIQIHAKSAFSHAQDVVNARPPNRGWLGNPFPTKRKAPGDSHA